MAVATAVLHSESPAVLVSQTRLSVVQLVLLLARVQHVACMPISLVLLLVLQ